MFIYLKHFLHCMFTHKKKGQAAGAAVLLAIIAGLLVMFIGIGQMFAGYIYPNQPDEINRTVEGYEKK